MHKFKVGDKVVVGEACTGFMERLRYTQGVRKYYTITRTSAGGYWLQLDGVQRYGDPVPWCSEYFELYQEPEDEQLPPAPNSVRYYHENPKGLDSDEYLDVYSDNFFHGPRIRLRNKVGIGITIDADTALQLAHDLRRMAMEIKRKEKQSEV